MHGGFDSEFNHSGTRFLIVQGNNFTLRTVCSDYRGPSPRGYHSAVYCPTAKTSDGEKSNCVYTFGGQCCLGGPYTFFNDVHQLDLKQMSWQLVNCSGTPPSPRSQSFCFIYNGCMYVYGGYNGTNLFTDLHKLDLATKTWHKINTKGNPPSGLKGLSPLDFHIYFCQPQGVLLGKTLVLVSESYSNFTFTIFTLNLKTLTWRHLRGKSGFHQSKNQKVKTPVPFDPPARGNPTVTLLKGDLILLGGHPRDPIKKNSTDSRIWRISLPKSMPWEAERLLWLACYKNNRDECLLAKCPPVVIYHIIGFVNSNTFNMN